MQDKKTVYVFPTSRSIREFIFGFKSKNTLLPATITIDEFLKKSISLNNKKYETLEQRVINLNEAIKNIDLKKLGISKNFAQFLKQSDYIYRFFLELSSEQTTIQKLQIADTYEFYSEHLEILNEILISYKEILKKNSLVNRVNLDEFYTINDKFISRFDEIFINFEGYFTKQEFEIVKKISKKSNLLISFNSNIYNQKSLEIFNELNYKFKLNYEYVVDLTNSLIVKENETNSLLQNYEIKAFASRFNQVAFIKSKIVNLVNKGINPTNIAVVLPNEDFSKILELNDNEEYFNFAMGKSIEDKEIFQKANTIFSYINEQDNQNIDTLNYFGIDKDFIDKNISIVWQKSLTKNYFYEICEFIKKDETNLELLEKYDELVYFLEKIFFASENSLKVKDAFKIFLQNLAKIKLDDAHSGKVTVMGLLETRMVNFDAVIICDFNENFIPKVSVKDKFLSSKLKTIANLPTIKDRENLQKYYYKRLIDSSKNIFISYVESNESKISRFAYELFDFKKSVLEDNIYKDILYKSKKLEYKDEEILLNIDLTKQTWSASSLKMFLECKRRWYLNYILKLKEHTISRLPKSFELGSLVHSILEEYYKNKNSNIEDIFLKYKSNNPFLILDLEVFKHNILKLLEDDKKRLQTRQIIEIEKKFSINYCDFELNGVIDRVDKYEDSFELIDYKTSRSLKVDTINTYSKSCDFQLEFYFLAIKELYKSANMKAFYYDIFENSLKEEIVLNEKLELLETIFGDLKLQSQSKIDFCKTQDKTLCEYCSFKTICNRD